MSDGGISAGDIDNVVALARAHSWVPLVAVIVAVLIRLAKSDNAVRWFPILVQPRWRPWLSLALGVTGGVVEKLASGGTWGEAIAGGLAAGLLPITGHELVVESLRNGRDVGVAKATPPPPGPPTPLMFPPPSRPPPPISWKPPPMGPPPAPPPRNRQ